MLGYKWKRVRLFLKHKRNKAEFELKQAQIEDLKQLEYNGCIDLYLGDENHFGLTPNVPCAWQLEDKPLLLPAANGKFLNVVGLMSRKNDLFFQVLQSTFNTDRIIDLYEKFEGKIWRSNRDENKEVCGIIVHYWLIFPSYSMILVTLNE